MNEKTMFFLNLLLKEVGDSPNILIQTKRTFNSIKFNT